LNDIESIVLEVGSVEEAKKIAAAKWSLDLEDLAGKIIEEEKSFFGFLGRKLTVEVRPVASLSLLKAKNALKDIINRMDLDAEVSSLDEKTLNISGQDSGIVIGKYGETIKSLEYIVNLMDREEDHSGRIRLDSDGYRDRRSASLQRLAMSASRRALRRNRPAYLEPMTSWERRIIHLTLKDRNDVETRSVGEDPERKVVIYPSAMDYRK
jgi:spoIIIJ-associated protein